MLQTISKPNSLFLALLLICAPSWLLAAEELAVVSDGLEIRVLYFEPDAVAEAPPLALLVAGGSNNKFMARAQSWLGKEMVKRGWAVAVPISPDGGQYFVQRPDLFPEIIADLHRNHPLRVGKALLVGISSGGSSALAIAAQKPEHYLGVVATPGRAKEESLFREMKGLPVYLRFGERDSFRWHRRMQETVEILEHAGADVDAALVPDAKHIFRMDWDELESWLDEIDSTPL